MNRARLCAALALLAAACGREDVELVTDAGPGANDAGTSIPGLVSIDVTPETSTVTILDVTVVQSVTLTATGTFDDGGTRDVTGDVTWGVDNTAPGAFVSPGLWQTSNDAGGAVTVAAQAGSISAEATIDVLFRPSLDDPTFPPPPDAPELFDPTTPVVVADPTSSPLIVYPSHETMFPRNVYRVLFQYNQGAGTDVYRVRFTSEFLDMSVYTTGDRWQADETTWGFLAATNAGSVVQMTVAGVDSSNPTTIYESAPIDVFFSLSEVEGAIYYWSTSSEGVMKGVLSEPAPTKFYTQPPSDTCVACHTVSRDGKRLAVGYDGETLQEVSVPARDVVVSESRGYEMGWSTFSPDGSLLLLANKGGLTLIDSDTGDSVGPDDGAVNLGGALATHPDWSPLGDYVAVAVCTTGDKNKDVAGCSIGRVPYDGGAWGEIEILHAATGAEDNNFFPKYSPDGQWIAYVGSTGKSKDQPTSALYMIPATGGTPVELAIGNHRVGPLDGVADTGSTMPTWAPTTHPGTQWLALSSIRDYGKILVGDHADQLWVMAIDLDRAAAGEDPSFAAFWLPLQDVNERNHRAFWAHDADEPCDGVEVCDGFDNDCDGQVDEDCEVCVDLEVCFDGADNDCDGLVDEGCIG